VIALLRFIGLLNTGVWLGACVLFTFGIRPAISSATMQELLGARNFPFFSEAIGEVMLRNYGRLPLVCAVVAVLHVLGERLYLGKSAGRLRLSLLTGLCALAVLASVWFVPRLGEWNRTRYGVNAARGERQAAAESFDLWRRRLQLSDLLALGGLGIYLWRMANPPEPTRFLGSGQFRS